MDKTVMGLIGAVTALGGVSFAAQAATAPPANLDDVMSVSSYADLLKPIPNASALLHASVTADIKAAMEADAAEAAPRVVEVGYYHHHHHHHHHHIIRRIIRRRIFHHHHHHHHHSNY
jgi:hypothetical protein